MGANCQIQLLSIFYVSRTWMVAFSEYFGKVPLYFTFLIVRKTLVGDEKALILLMLGFGFYVKLKVCTFFVSVPLCRYKIYTNVLLIFICVHIYLDFTEYLIKNRFQTPFTLACSTALWKGFNIEHNEAVYKEPSRTW